MHNIFNEMVCVCVMGYILFELITGAANFIFAFRPLADSNSKIQRAKMEENDEDEENER